MRVIIVGKGGSGKDFLKDKLISKGFTRSVSVTTRPKRIGEIEGVDYNFITPAVFELLIGTGELQEYDKFNGWYYGTTKEEWDKHQIFIKTPSGMAKVSSEDRKACFVIYLDIAEHVRYNRLLKRNDADKAFRRLEADEKDFSTFIDFDLRVTNHDF